MARHDLGFCFGVHRRSKKAPASYDYPPEDDVLCEENPNPTIDDMSEKAELSEKSESNVLPSVKEQVTSLLTSLDLHDLQKCPVPDLESTLKILANLDQTLQSTGSTTLRSYHRGDLTLDAARLDSMRTSVDELSEAVESCLANLSSHLIPSLGRAKLGQVQHLLGPESERNQAAKKHRPNAYEMSGDASEKGEKLVARSEGMHSVAQVLQGMYQRYHLPPEGDLSVSCKTDPNLTIEDMGEKGEILKNLLSNLLPSIIEQIPSLVTSLDLDDLKEEHPVPDVRLALEILSNLDQTLKSILSSISSLTQESPRPDKRYDHCLQTLKVYRFSQLRSAILLIMYVIIDRLAELCGASMRWHAAQILVTGPAQAWTQASKLKRAVHVIRNHGRNLIAETIAWHEKSDWAVIQEDWLHAAETCDKRIENLTNLSNMSLKLISHLACLPRSSSEEPDMVAIIHTRRKSAIGRMGEVARTAILLAKLARTMARKVSQMIPRKPIFELDTEINSETLEQFRNAFESTIKDLPILLRCLGKITWEHPRLTIPNRDEMVSSANGLARSFNSTSTLFASPLLDEIEHSSPGIDFKAWRLSFGDSWDKVVDRLLYLVSSFEVEPEQQPDQDN
ncbi:hypothetical protein H4Q26_016420 [Puccinia striiformis f. sp. tritici PST-130]|nr:hypothetical protein H4Q26_016420 [Puccinia striiformis f. sp. tritici PST-130]